MREMKIRLGDLLDLMDVPEERKNLNLLSNIRWLRANLVQVNNGHNDLDEAEYLVRNLSKRLRC